jgi:hypothetical protein
MTGRRIKAATAAALLIGSSSLALGAGVSHALASSAPVSTATVPTSTTYGYESYAGSAKYLAYGRFAVETNGRLAPTGELFVRTIHGKPRKIAAISRAHGAVSVAGSMLVHEESDLTGSATTVTWTNLATGAHGTFESQNGVYAAPTGWITITYSAATPQVGTVYLHAAAGGTTKLGTPRPHGGGFGLSVGPSTVVADSPYEDLGNGRAEYVSLNHPGKFHPLIPVSEQTVSARCDSITSKFIACYTTGSKQTAAIYTVTGKLIASTTRHCPVVPAVDGSSMAWVVQAGSSCPSHQLVIVSPHAQAKVVPGTFGVGTPTAAFGRIVVGKHLVDGNRWFKQLVVITSGGNQRTILGGKP